MEDTREEEHLNELLSDIDAVLNDVDTEDNDVADTSSKPSTPIYRGAVSNSETAQLRKIFPENDKGLIYAIFLTAQHQSVNDELDGATIERYARELTVLSKLRSIFDERKDFPEWLRNRLARYLNSLYKHADLFDAEDAHCIYALEVLNFIDVLECDDALLESFLATIIYDYIDAERGFFFEEIKAETSNSEPWNALYPVSRYLDEANQSRIETLFPPNDNGLIYTVFLALCHMDKNGELGATITSLKALNLLGLGELHRLYEIRRDFPRWLRERLRTYLASLPSYSETAPAQMRETENAHKVFASQAERFLKDIYNQNLFLDFYQRIECDHTDLQNDFNIRELYGPLDNRERVEWLSIDALNIAAESVSEDNATYFCYIKKLKSPGTLSKPRLPAPAEAIFNKLLDDFPNFAEVISFYKAQFRLRKLTRKDRLAPVLLLGEPGIGKTHFAQALAKSLETGYEFIDIASTSDAWVLSGLHASWKGGKPGKVFRAMVQSPTLSPVILLDEVDKARSGRNDASTPLYQLLEETNAKSFVDEFIDAPADLSHIIFIATANTLEGLSEPLQTRFRVFNIPSPTEEQHIRILDHIYEEETGRTHLFSYHLSPEVARELTQFSVRESKLKLQEAIGRTLLELSEEQIAESPRIARGIEVELRHLSIDRKKASSSSSIEPTKAVHWWTLLKSKLRRSRKRTLDRCRRATSHH
ncbi:ATPase [Caballeronia peredens]|nr:ATPase [Caballeronia peredens]